jgi:DNA-binding FrmR family transcriptional regulator
LPDEDRNELVSRLKRIEGQARGIQKMIEDGRECTDVLNQIAAMKAAAGGLAGQMLEVFALNCLRHPEAFPNAQVAIEEAVKAVVRSGR